MSLHFEFSQFVDMIPLFLRSHLIHYLTELVCDFGLSQVKEQDKMLKDDDLAKGTRLWMASVEEFIERYTSSFVNILPLLIYLFILLLICYLIIYLIVYLH